MEGFLWGLYWWSCLGFNQIKPSHVRWHFDVVIDNEITGLY